MELIRLEQAYTSLEKQSSAGRSAPCIPTAYDGAALLFRSSIVRRKAMLIY